MSARIIISVFVAFIISFSILVVFLHHFQSTLEIKETEFYSQKFDPNINKIFLVGSSHVGQLNATFINDFVSNHEKKYQIYNLAHSADSPNLRLNSLKEIIALKPKIVVYGIGYRDFGDTTAADQKQSVLPNPQQIFSKLFSFDNFGNFDYLKAPKITTLNVIRDSQAFRKGFSPEEYTSNTPFYPYDTPDVLLVRSNDEIKNNFKANEFIITINPPDKNSELVSLNKIIDELQKNNIKVVIFVTPYQRAFLDSVTSSENQTFNSIITSISQVHSVKIYDLRSKYADQNIWSNVDHVAYNEKSIIYSEDIAKIILQEIES